MLLPTLVLLAATASPVCAPVGAPGPVEAVGAMYAAAMAGDDAGVRARLTPDFYAFERGQRMSADQILAMLAQVRAQHLTYVWSVQDPQVEVRCDMALVAYANRGSITDAAGTRPQNWVESVRAMWDGARWRIAFLHSSLSPR